LTGLCTFGTKPANVNQLQNWPSDKGDFTPLLSGDKFFCNPVSAFITPIAPISVDTAAQPSAGTITDASVNEAFVITDPNANVNDPVAIITPDSGINRFAAGTEGADIVIAGNGATIGITTALDANGNVLNGSGSTFQVDEDYEGSVVANLEGAITGSKVDTSTETFSGNTIADAAPSNTDDFDFYISTGANDDEVEGSAGNDFIRLGAGDDVANAEGGDDVVRLGSGDDVASLGAGNDVVYFTIDQLQGEQVKVITDFDAEGDDKILIDESLEDLVSIDGVGSNVITITLSGDQTGETDVVSEAGTIDEDDIEFV